jgi:hypothetical protein
VNKLDMKPVTIDPTIFGRRPIYIHRTEPTPYTVYAMLRDFYGTANGRSDSSRTQWSYELEIAGAYIRVRDWNKVSWVVEIWHDQHDDSAAERIGQEFLALVAQKMPHYEKKIKALAASARYTTLQNPFKIYFASAERLLALAQNTPNVSDREDLCRSAFFLFLSSFEGLLNLIYDLYLKPFLIDERIREGLIRANIDVKLRLAPLYCVCFSSDVIKYAGDELKRYYAIVELRNDFIHANLSPTMKTPIIQDDGFVFYAEQRATNNFNIPKNLAYIDMEHLLFVKQTIGDMTDAVINAMSHRYKHDFSDAIMREQIIIEQIDGENYIRTSL